MYYLKSLWRFLTYFFTSARKNKIKDIVYAFGASSNLNMCKKMVYPYTHGLLS